IFIDDAKPLADGRRRWSVGRRAAKTDPAATAATRTSSVPGLLTLIKRLVTSPTQAVAVMTRQLATLLKAGIPLPESLAALIEQVDHEELHGALVQVAERVREGIAFAKALEEHPRLFAGLYVSMVAAGEASGNL